MTTRPVSSAAHNIDLTCGTIFDYVIPFRMAKAHGRPYATVCKAIRGGVKGSSLVPTRPGYEARKEVALGSFDSPRPQT